MAKRAELFPPVKVQLKNRKRATLRPQSLVVETSDMSVVVVDPPNPVAVRSFVDDLIRFGATVLALANKIYGGGGGKMKCTSTISQTTDPNTGAITTTVTTTCEPAPT